MQERVLIKDLAAHEDGPVRVSGWVEKVRDQKFVQFVVLRDETGAVQLVNGGVLREADPENPRSDILLERTGTITELTHGTFITVTGELQHNERVKLGGVEIQIDKIEVVTRALPDNPVADDSGIDVRLDWRFLDLRRPEQNLVFRVQTTFLHALRQVWVERGFIEIQTPKLMASASESRAELFEVEYFEGKAFLAQSPQFFKQMAQAAGFGGIFEVGPAFRADPSFTSRHATEFTSIDAELSWIDSHEDVMELHEELMVAGITAVKEKHGAEIEKLFGIEIEVPSRPFPRIPLAEAKEIVKERGYEVPRADADMDPEGERQIAAYAKEKFGHDFVFLTDYAASIRPFYHMLNEEDPSLTKSYDLIYRGTEISTGAQREHRVEVLEEQAKAKGMDPAELAFYLDFFRYGMPAHGGFGMGLNRVLMLMLHQPSIRETTYLFRGPNRLLP
ncbi:aspartate--tRNA(Asn) ligase [Leucobacter sp. UT-8R-CII-1-4]|uniref:aspartate--tRNA(Asn) ligase n=1 Tax=Leucobacter sp. UT-8R-CII-1-4 TaxID=3040075 RepID=UPI0024A7D8CB|nr:aspartate--tRNA(Asn) ligase [Leucobacter sp. UT-8R-CII-1-4]MDI6023709.1 aspartate--tRNA(Asn) ligase [Leucobacter sp. UT-8R-CII-1-4]